MGGDSVLFKEVGGEGDWNKPCGIISCPCQGNKWERLFFNGGS